MLVKKNVVQKNLSPKDKKKSLKTIFGRKMNLDEKNILSKKCCPEKISCPKRICSKNPYCISC